MDSETEELHFQRLQELVLDDDQIVTIPYLARTLNISITDSKKLIRKYVEDQRKLNCNNQLYVTYTITGTLRNGKGDGIILFNESDIEDKEDLFDDIHSEVIFSIQKNSNVDFNVIALVDKFDSGDIKNGALSGSIVGKECTKRKQKLKKLPTPPPPTVKGKSSFFASKTSSGKSNEVKAEPKASAAATEMLNKASVSKSNQKEEIKSVNKAKKPTIKTKGTLSTFFSHSNSGGSQDGKTETKPNGTSSAKFDEEIDVTDFMEVKMTEDKSVKEEKDEKENKQDNVSHKTDVKEKKKSKNKKKRNRSQEEGDGKSVKKRKRIIERNDSDSDDLFGSDSVDEDVIDKSDEEPEKPPSPVPEPVTRVKGKKRIAVDKTYLDSEGFLVTKTEFEYVDASDEEVIESPKKEKPTVKPMEKKQSTSSDDVPPHTTGRHKKGKKNNMQNQPTLMNFFKKK